MTHLRIELNNIQENVSSAVIEKLYLLASSGDLDASSHLAGNLYVPATYLEYIDVLTDLTDPKFRDLTITAGNIYIMFADPEVLRVLLANNIGDGIGVTVALAALANLGTIFLNNTTALTFNELLYFTGLTRIPTNAFKGCTSLSLVTLPLTTSIIGENAFNSVPISSINLSNITKLENRAFCVAGDSSSGFEVNAPNLTTFLDAGLFLWANVSRVISLGSVTNIPGSCFDTCPKLTSVNLPTTCALINSEAFLACTSLLSINLSNVLTLRNNCFKLCTALTSVDISNCTSIGTGVFYYCPALLTVTYSTSLTTVPNSCFRECTNLTTISGLSNVTSIEALAFYLCSSLTTCDIDWTKITSIGSSAFDGSCLSGSINLSNVISIGNYVFNGTNITSISIPSGITDIPTLFCNNCTNLTSLTIPNTVTTIGVAAFLNTKISSFDFTNITSIGQLAFKNTLLTSVNFGNSLVLIGSDAFSGLSLSYVEIPSSVTEVGAGAFSSTTTHYKINEGVLTLGNHAFRGDRLILPSTITTMGLMGYTTNSREFVVMKATTPPTYPNNAFSGNFYFPVYVPDASVAAYKALPGGTAGNVAWENRVKSFTDFANDYPGISLNGTGYATDPV